MFINYKRNNGWSLAFDEVSDADGYTIYRMLEDNTQVFYQEVKVNECLVHHAEIGDEFRVVPYKLQDGKKIFLSASNIILQPDIRKDELRCIPVVNKSSVNLYFTKITNVVYYSVHILKNGIEKEFTKIRNNFCKLKFLPVGEISLYVEAYDSNSKVITRSDNITFNIKDVELFAFNKDGKITLYWTKAPKGHSYRIFVKESSGKYKALLRTENKSVYFDDVIPGRQYDYKLTTSVVENKKRIFGGLSAKCSIKINSTDYAKLTIIEAYDNKIGLSWNFEGTVDGWEIYKNGKLYAKINEGLEHIAILDFSEDEFYIRGYQYYYNEKIYTVESNRAKLSNIRSFLPESYKLSVIIPAYNAEEFISRTILTVLLSTIDDVELVIVDDGSTDKTQEIITWYANKYSNFVKYIFKDNSGISDTRNKGIEFVHGKYTAFMDNDDMIRPDMFERMYNEIEKTRSDIVITPFYRIDDYGYELSMVFDFEENVAIDTVEYLKLLLNNNYGNVSIWNKLYKSELVKQHPFGIAEYEDLAWTPLILSWADTFCYLNSPSYEWDRKIRSSTFSYNLRARNELEKFQGRYDSCKFFMDNGNPKHKSVLAFIMAKRLYRRWSQSHNECYSNAIKEMKDLLLDNKFVKENSDFGSKILELLK